MTKDFKTGLIIGALIIIAAASTLPFWGQFKFSSAPMPRSPAKDLPDLSVGGDFENDPIPPMSGQQRSQGEAVNLSKTFTTENTDSVSSEIFQSSPQDRQKPLPAPRPPAFEYHTVQSGQTLSSIARQYYGNSELWRRIADANRDILDENNLIRPGMKLKIPR